MRIKETNLGNGLSRLDVEPMFREEENLPTFVVDEIMRDIIERKRSGEKHCKCVERDWNCSATRAPRFTEPTMTNHCNCHCHHEAPRREPDGIDVHVDRPLRENFDDIVDWIVAMDKYRTLEDAAKECDWECREPMKGVEKHCEFDDERCFEDEEEFIEFDSEAEFELLQALSHFHKMFR